MIVSDQNTWLALDARFDGQDPLIESVARGVLRQHFRFCLDELEKYLLRSIKLQ